MNLTWDPPGKGDWRGLHDHFPRALTPEYQRLLAVGMEEGEADYFERYGLPARTLQPAFVHGRVFVTAAPLVGPPSNRVPPRSALWLAVRLVPAFRRRAAAARRALEERPWLAEATHWYDVERPAWIERNRSVEAVQPADLSDADLADHIRAARANAADGYRTHFRLHGTDLIPTALFLLHAANEGMDPVEATALLTGSSPASRGEGELPEWRLVTGYDLDDRCAAELPTIPPRPRCDESLYGATERTPDVWLADARATYGLRDDNGLYTAAWPVGLLRRAMVDAGRRLHERGRLHDPEHAVELTVDELVTALERRDGAPGAEAVAERADERARLSQVSAPPSLGPDLELPVDAMPPAMRTMTSALLLLRDLGITPPGQRTPLEGVGIGTETGTGRPCVATDPSEALARFEPGDIIVTAGTCPAWNTLLAAAGGIVTEEGGPLSHAAVIARELGLPALIGTADATSLLLDGTQIELDAVAGTVRALS